MIFLYQKKTKMRKIAFIICILICFQTKIFAQFSEYSIRDNVEFAVFEVEDMTPIEIKMYNYVVLEKGGDPDGALYCINVLRANKNLKCAPPTIVDFRFAPEIKKIDSTLVDSYPDVSEFKEKDFAWSEKDEGACLVLVEVLNTTTKKIREITFEFEFENDGVPIYDIKTGDKYCILKFQNIGGRAASSNISEIAEAFHECKRLLTYNEASYKKLFYNKKATTAILHQCTIKYEDGTVSNKVALFNNMNNNATLLDDGPLKPYRDFCRKIVREGKI